MRHLWTHVSFKNGPEFMLCNRCGLQAHDAGVFALYDRTTKCRMK